MKLSWTYCSLVLAGCLMSSVVGIFLEQNLIWAAVIANLVFITATKQPTESPELSPIVEPTPQPSRNPTSQPSRQPTSQPTRQPTRQPTSQPSRQPTSQPSRQPTRQPTAQPTSSPSRQPTGQPSRQPTSQPSSQPSRKPTAQPSRMPSAQPSRQPSGQPTASPTQVPSVQPTSAPSTQPTNEPSGLPTTQPTSNPTSPSSMPSIQPTGQPVSNPTSQPSAQPFSQPTGAPTGQPSAQPSAQPFSRPTSQPSTQPSSQPTLQPFAMPSSEPSAQPSSLPSAQPSSHPTSQPSRQPTAQPSSVPSAQPSSSPTRQPTMQPSSSPTGQPSSQPTGEPSMQPTSRPSRQPSMQPSSAPTIQPSSSPTSQPSSQPSSRPTLQPFSHPSARPSTQPSGQPSAQPSSSPTREPTAQPTIQPTAQPVSRPTSQPSMQPSSQPSSDPSAQPTGQPTRQPSSQPSCNPTSHPSNQPTGQPTSQPSAEPTAQPSACPTNQPSSRPTHQPTNQPSSQPTRQPSRQPTAQPSRQPSSQPSAQPSSAPSMQPSSQPTSVPSGSPTSQPSTQPTAHPSRIPTAQPSAQPTTQPSRQPTAQPTSEPTSQPSACPSSQPTAQPSSQPSSQPTSRPTEICAKGEIHDGTGCKKCPAGTTSVGGALAYECVECQPGYYAPEEGSEECLPCPLGHYCDAAAMSVPTACDFNTYNDKTGGIAESDTCKKCGSNKITGFRASESELACVNPRPNFITGSVTLAVAIYVAYRYMFRSRLHRVAFLRRERLQRQMITACRQIYQNLEAISLRRLDEVPPVNRLGTWGTKISTFLKVIGFLLMSTVLVIIVTVGGLLISLLNVFYSALILWRGLTHVMPAFSIPFEEQVEKALGQFAVVLSGLCGVEIPASAVQTIYYPFTQGLKLLQSIDLSALSGVQITCYGAQAPVELLVDCLILGVVVIAVEADFQLFWDNSVGGVIQKFVSMLVNPRLLEAAKILGQRGSFDKQKFLGYVFKALLLSQLTGVANPFQLILRYLMGFVTIEAFIQDGGKHRHARECDFIDGYRHFDYYLAVFSTIFAYVVLQAAVYVLAKVLVPRLPLWAMNDLSGRRLEADDPDASRWFAEDSWLGKTYRWLSSAVNTCFSVFSPDTWISQVAYWCVAVLSNIIQLDRHDATIFLTARRTKEETATWRTYHFEKLPSFIELAHLVTRSLGESLGLAPEQHYWLYPLSIWLPVQLCTKEGRICWKVVFWNIGVFFAASLGIWTDTIYDQFAFDASMRRTNPEIADEVVVRAGDSNLLEADSDDGSEGGKRKKDEVDIRMHALQQLGTLTSMQRAQQCDEQSASRTQFANALAAIVGMRAVLLQASNILTPLSVYSVFTAGTPMFVHPNSNMHHRLQPWFVPDAMAIARSREDKTNRGDTSRTWILRLLALNIWVSESRFVQYTTNLYKFAFAMAMLLIPQRTILMIALLAIVVPISFLNALMMVVFFGRVAGVRDEDFRVAFCTAYCCKKDAADSDVESQSSNNCATSQQQQPPHQLVATPWPQLAAGSTSSDDGNDQPLPMPPAAGSSTKIFTLNTAESDYGFQSGHADSLFARRSSQDLSVLRMTPLPFVADVTIVEEKKEGAEAAPASPAAVQIILEPHNIRQAFPAVFRNSPKPVPSTRSFVAPHRKHPAPKLSPTVGTLKNIRDRLAQKAEDAGSPPDEPPSDDVT